VTEVVGRRERQREATYEEIVRVSRDLLDEGRELSLRAVAGRMGMTAPALYRYVASYQELVDLVAFEIDKAATETFRAAASRAEPDDPAGQLLIACVAFRRWALANPREFSLVFANPVADSACVRRELLAASTSGHYMTGLLFGIWQKHDFPVPDLDEFAPSVREALLDPLIPADVDAIPDEKRGLVWIFMRSWAALYGVVTLEVFGHMDPRMIENGAVFAAFVREWMPRLGMDADRERLEALLAEELAHPPRDSQDAP
jgi:AcrR family transcriptional regulator